MENDDFAIRGSYKPPSTSRMKLQEVSSENTSNESANFDDDSSLSVLDLNTLPDARRSVSLIHMQSKNSSLGSWLEQSLTNENQNPDEQDIENTNIHQLYRSEAFDLEGCSIHSDMLQPYEINELNAGPIIENLKTPFATGSEDSNNLDFEFNEDELDIDVLINENEIELDDTMTSEITNNKQESNLSEQVETSKNKNEKSTTFDFLKGLSLPQLYEEADGGDAKLDSFYFVSTTLQSLPGSQFYDSRNANHETNDEATFINPLEGNQVKDGSIVFAPQRTSTTDIEPFHEWNCKAPLDFSGLEFQVDSNLQQEILGEEEFAPASDVANILDHEEEMFEKENQFILDENFVASDDNFNDFSNYRTSNITVSGDEGDLGKVSIGAYIAERSGKLGNLNSKVVTNRPSFGLKVRTPSPQKPCKLVSVSNLSTIEDESTLTKSDLNDLTQNSKSMMDAVLPIGFDETVDQSMMSSLSNAISNMSSSLNNEELAKFIIALSNKKVEEKKKKEKSTIIVKSDEKEEKPTDSSTNSTISNKTDNKSSVDSDGSEYSGINSTLREKSEIDENLKKIARNTRDVTISSSTPSERTSRKDATHQLAKPLKSNYDELPSLPNETLFSPESISSGILSSTRANLSLTRGSLSRDSIEQLHKKLRINTDFGLSGLPDVVSTQPNNTNCETISRNYSEPHKCDALNVKELTTKKFDITDESLKKFVEDSKQCSISPLSQSSPDSHETKLNKIHDGNLTRLSAAFQQLLPSMSFNEMATVAESQFEEQQFHSENLLKLIEGNENVDLEKKKDEISIGSKHDLSSCSSVDAIPKASSTRTNEVDFNRSEQSSVSSDASLPQQRVDIASYPQYQLMRDMLPNHPMLGAYLSNDPHIYHRVHHSLVHMPPSMQSVGHSYMGDNPTFDSTVYGVRPHTSYNYPHVLPYQHQPMLQGRSFTQDYMQDGLSYISTPRELVFDKHLCVGVPSNIVLPLKNNSPRWVQVELRAVSISINRQLTSSNPSNHVTMKLKHLIGPHAVEHTNITLSAQEEGQYDITVEVVCHLISLDGATSQSPRCNINTLNVKAFVESPSACVCSSNVTDKQQKYSIDFGEIVCGTSKCLPVRILNQSKFEIPIRMMLFTSSCKQSCFSLSLSSSMVQYDDVNTGTMSVLCTVLAVSDQPITIWLHFQSSTRQFSADEKPVKVDARVEVTLDAPYKADSVSSNTLMLDTVNVMAVVGVGKLHAPRSQQLMSFNTSKGSSQVKKFPVKNAGNITVQVVFAFEAYSDYFNVKPCSAILPPGDAVELSVEFKPSQSSASNQSYSTLLLMNILPDGPHFEVQISGRIVDIIPSSQPSQPTSLLTNKTRLRWGGVPIGKSRKQKLTLRSGQTTKPVSFRASIKGDANSSFQIMTMDGEELCTRSDMTISPGQDKTICVLFAPPRRRMVDSKLEIKTPIDDLPATKFTIPLSGYGGTSRVCVEDLMENDEEFPPMHNDYVPKSYNLSTEDAIDFKLTNHGSRSAFVKIMVYSNTSYERVSSDFICQPSQFVLQEHQSRKVNVKSAKTAGKSLICIWHGDELSRQLLKLAMTQHSSASSLVARCVPQSSAYLRCVPFDGIFDNEDACAEEDLTKLEPHSFDAQLFYLNIRQTIVSLVGNEKNLSKSVGSLFKTKTSQTNDEVPERDVGLLLEKLKKQTPALSLNTSDDSYSLNWEITPTHITVKMFPSNHGMPEPTRVKIKNQSLSSLMYDIVWPGHYLTITPNRGKVEPESVAVLLVSANPSLTSQKGLLPWCGQVVVVATASSQQDNTRTIYVQILESTSPPSVPKVETPMPMEALPETLKLETAIQLISKNLVDFRNVTIGSSSKSHIEFRNMSKCNLKWILTSLAPSYVKNASSSEIYRSSYAAFVFSHKSGVLEPGARVQVPLTFNPMNVGLYSQQWEIKHHDAADHSAMSMRQEKIQLLGQGLIPNKTKPVTLEKPSIKSDIHIEEECYYFNNTNVGKSSIIKIPIKNKGKMAHTVQFLNLRPPFYITHHKHSIRAMYCANLPITFKATHVGSYTGTLVVQSDDNDVELHIMLKGKAVENL